MSNIINFPDKKNRETRKSLGPVIDPLEKELEEFNYLHQLKRDHSSQMMKTGFIILGFIGLAISVLVWGIVFSKLMRSLILSLVGA